MRPKHLLRLAIVLAIACAAAAVFDPAPAAGDAVATSAAVTP
jgi:hypothetical protein